MSINDSAEFGFVTDESVEIDQAVYDIGFDVPAGRRLFVANRRVRLSDNAYVVNVIRLTDGFSGGTEGYHAPLYEGGTDNVGTRVYGGVTPSGTETVVSREFVEAGSTPGESRPVVRSDFNVALHSFINPFIIRIIRFSGGTPYRVSLNVVGYEIEVDE